MGVTYKIKQEIVNFIIVQKETNPSLSCRQLSIIVSDRFQTRVSKSSVNNVLKNAKMSSSVGRRSRKPEKKFTIPVEKKKEIQSNLSDINPIIEKSLPSVAPIQKDVNNSSQEKSKPIFEQDFLDKVKKKRKTTPLNGGMAIPEMGTIIFKVLEWRRENGNFLTKVFKPHIPIEWSDDIERICSLGLYNALFSERIKLASSGPLKNHTWSSFSESKAWKDNPLDEDILNRFKETAANLDLCMDFRKEWTYKDMDVGSIRLCFNGDQFLYMDPYFLNFSPKPIDFGTARSFSSLISAISQRLVSNTCPIIIRNLSLDTDMINELKLFFSVISGQEIFKKIEILDKKGEKLTDISVIPQNTKDFVVGINSDNVQFQEITQGAKWSARKPFYNEFSDQIGHYTVTKSPIFHKIIDNNALEDVTAFTLWFDEQKSPQMVIISNISDLDPESIINSYLECWPNVSQGSVLKATSKSHRSTSLDQDDQPIANIESGTIADVFKFYAEHLYREMKRDITAHEILSDEKIHESNYSSGVSSFISDVCNLSGFRVKLSEVQRAVVFVVPSDFKREKALGKFVRLLNEFNIVNFCDETISFRLQLDS